MHQDVETAPPLFFRQAPLPPRALRQNRRQSLPIGLLLFLATLLITNASNAEKVSANGGHTNHNDTHFSRSLEGSSPANKTTILPFEAHYSAKWNKVPLKGVAVRKLTFNENNQQEFSFNAKTLAAKIQESSQFSWQRCSPKPSAYLYERKGLLKRKKILLQTFNWKNQQVTSNSGKTSSSFHLPEQSTDKLSYQLAIRCDLKHGNTALDYQVVDKKRIKQYSFKIIGDELLETPLGILKTVKVERIRDANERQTFLWFAKELDYLLVKLEQNDTGANHYVINIKALQNSQVTAKQ